MLARDRPCVCDIFQITKCQNCGLDRIGNHNS
jgi:hypothetical protein